MRPALFVHFAPVLVLAAVLLPGCGKDDNPTQPPAPAAFASDVNTLVLWHMDEGTGPSVADASGLLHTLYLGEDATAEAADPTWSSPGFNGIGAALTFDGSQSEHTRCPGPFTFPSDQFSVEFMLKTANASNMPLVFGTNNVSVYVWITPAGVVQFDIGNGTNWGASASSLVSVADGAWHYVACTYDHAATRVYVDGVLSATTPQVLDVADPSSMYVGGRPSNTFLTGSMDEVRISNTARSAAEIDAFQHSR
jgi:hypothetical protein